MATNFKGPVFSATNVCKALTSTPTAAAITTLNRSSSGIQYFTGATTQTMLMPPAIDTTQAGTQTILPLGYEITVWNASTGTVTVQDSAAGAIGTVTTGLKKTVVLVSAATTAGTWAIL